MRKQNKAKILATMPTNNPVAKFAYRFNKAKVFADKRQYQRQSKHQGLEPFSIGFAWTIEKGFKSVWILSGAIAGF